jgi:hypothetical protein
MPALGFLHIVLAHDHLLDLVELVDAVEAAVSLTRGASFATEDTGSSPRYFLG